MMNLLNWLSFDRIHANRRKPVRAALAMVASESLELRQMLSASHGVADEPPAALHVAGAQAPRAVMYPDVSGEWDATFMGDTAIMDVTQKKGHLKAHVNAMGVDVTFKGKIDKNELTHSTFKGKANVPGVGKFKITADTHMNDTFTAFDGSATVKGVGEVPFSGVKIV